MAKNPGKIKSFLPKAIFSLGIVALAFISVAIYRETRAKQQVQSEIASLQQEAEQVDRENAQIQDKITYLESPDYQQREAKDKLNLQSPDENVVIVKPAAVPDNQVPEENVPAVPIQPPQAPNPLKWWNYFFKY